MVGHDGSASDVSSPPLVGAVFEIRCLGKVFKVNGLYLGSLLVQQQFFRILDPLLEQQHLFPNCEGSLLQK